MKNIEDHTKKLKDIYEKCEIDVFIAARDRDEAIRLARREHYGECPKYKGHPDTKSFLVGVGVGAVLVTFVSWAATAYFAHFTVVH